MSPDQRDTSAPSSSAPPVIGIVGGVGPFAGLDLQRKILEETIATGDPDHLPVIAVSWPQRIPDRTEYLLGHITDNPARAIVAQLRLLADAGATVAGIPCNTAHAPAIFDVIREGVGAFERPLRLLHMIDETAAHLMANHPALQTIGVLSTTGAWQTRLYPAALEPLGYRVVAPDEARQVATIHPAVYDPVYGIKANGRVSARARAALEQAAAYLCRQGAEAIIVGCTEMPLAFTEQEFDGRTLIDPTRVLARALVRAVAPQQLKV
ncbi:MAG: aspartate/glutamate racemase family protein [Candidatus Promineofilum sp.]|nr:aspartate/glutamate racemase family protein [Promineifilum sp.]